MLEKQEIPEKISNAVGIVLTLALGVSGLIAKEASAKTIEGGVDDLGNGQTSERVNPYTCEDLMAPDGPGYNKFYNGDPNEPIICETQPDGGGRLTH